MNVRTATIGDVEGVQRVATAAWHAAHDAIVGEDAVDEFLADYYDVGSVAGRVADARIVFYVAEDQHLVGFATARPVHEESRDERPSRERTPDEQFHHEEVEGERSCDEKAERASGATTFSLQSIYVHPDHWEIGVGTRLLERVENEACAEGGDRLRLVVMADNERAIGFYEYAGFERVGYHYDERLDVHGYVYAKEL